MKSEFEKMRSGELYSYDDPQVRDSLNRGKALCARLRTMTMQSPGYRATIEELIPGLPETSAVMPPVHCDHGHGLRIGEHVFINAGCTFLDGGLITIGAHTLIGPNCQIYTPNHPTDHRLRRQPVETNLPVTIGADCWLGGGVIVLPGVTIGDRCIVTIGDRCIIGAGSVVTRDIPAGSLAVGNPARVVRSLDGGEAPVSAE